MNIHRKFLWSLAIVALLSAGASRFALAQSAPALGAAGNFAVLGGKAVTCVGPGSITGDVGSTGAFTPGACLFVGETPSATNAAAVSAQSALFSAYAELAGMRCDQTILIPAFTNNAPPLGPLAPGVYCFPATTADLTSGILTLDGPANGIWIFKIGTSGTGALTGTGFSVVMAGTANACNVSWWVKQAATMTDSFLKGTILAGTDITLTRGTLIGNAWATGDVTITNTALTGCP